MPEGSNEFVLARCGLVCSNCGAHKKGRCGGCHCDKPMNRGCTVKKCCVDRQFGTCAECKEFEDLRECGKLNNWVAKIFAFIFRSDRIGSLCRIRDVGAEQFCEEATAKDDR